MTKECVLRADPFTIKFHIFAVPKAQDGYGSVEYSIEFYLNANPQEPLFKSHRVSYLLTDLQIFADYLDGHLTRLIQTGNVEETNYTFLPYGTRFLARAGSGNSFQDDKGVLQFEFGLIFMVNIEREMTERTFLGSWGDVNAADVQDFVSQLRLALSEDF
jgi:hypothetical protein